MPVVSSLSAATTSTGSAGGGVRAVPATAQHLDDSHADEVGGSVEVVVRLALDHELSATKYLHGDGSYQPYVDAQGEGTYTDVLPNGTTTTRPIGAEPGERPAKKPNGGVIAVQSSLFQEEMVPVYQASQERGACPNCGSSQMYFSEGCSTCVVCGHSDCS